MRKKQTPSDYSIYVTGFPDNSLTKEEIRDHFSKFGEIIEIVFTRRFKDMMYDYMKQDTMNKMMKKREIIVKIKAEEKGEDIGDAVMNDKK
jgi:RNA recognition motif-containing protein